MCLIIIWYDNLKNWLNLFKRKLKKGVVIHRSLGFGKIDVRNQGLVIGRDLDTDFTNQDFLKK